MRGSTRYTISVLATGIMVLVFFVIPVFLGRFLCDLGFVIVMPPDGRGVRASPSGLAPSMPETEPNVPRQPSQASAVLRDEAVLETLGIIDYMESRMPGGCRCDVFSHRGEDALYLDRTSGQLVFRGMEVKWVDGEKRFMRRQYFGGPQGISETADQDLGRFTSPTVKHVNLHKGGYPLTVLHDPSQRRFFALDWTTRTVRASRQLDSSYHFTGFRSGDFSDVMLVQWVPSRYRVERKGEEDPARRYEWHFTSDIIDGDGGRYVPIIGDSRRIDLLDNQTMEIIEGRGYLPAPETLFGWNLPEPGQLLDCVIRPVYAYRERPADNEYLGMVVADVSRQGTSLAMVEFDPAGKPVSNVIHSKARTYRSLMRYKDEDAASAKIAALQTRAGPVLTVSKYILESLHPPVLTLASFFTVNRIAPRNGYQALFLMPNSYVAMQRDLVGEHLAVQLGWALLLMLPAVVLSLLLTWRINQDAYAVGLSQNGRALWALGTLLFGLPAYITYRLTRPAKGLVTCPNCGHGRRSDLDKCHRCGSPWLVPELTPPAWRVIGEPEEQFGNTAPVPNEETRPAT